MKNCMWEVLMGGPGGGTLRFHLLARKLTWPYQTVREAENLVIWLCAQGKEEMNFAEHNFPALDGGTFYYITSDDCLNLEQWLCYFV